MGALERRRPTREPRTPPPSIRPHLRPRRERHTPCTGHVRAQHPGGTMMSDFMRRPLRGLRLLVASAMLASFSFASPVTAVAVTDFGLDKPSTAVELVQGASAEATFSASWTALESAEPTLTVTSSQPWLVGTPASVDVTGTVSQEIAFTVDSSGLDVGSHEGTLTVSLEGSELTHAVSVTVTDPDTVEPDDALPGIDAARAADSRGRSTPSPTSVTSTLHACRGPVPARRGRPDDRGDRGRRTVGAGHDERGRHVDRHQQRHGRPGKRVRRRCNREARPGRRVLPERRRGFRHLGLQRHVVDL